MGKMETIEFGERSGDFKNGDSENTHFSRVNTENENGTCGLAHCHVILVGENGRQFVAFLLVFIAIYLLFTSLISLSFYSWNYPTPENDGSAWITHVPSNNL